MELDHTGMIRQAFDDARVRRSHHIALGEKELRVQLDPSVFPLLPISLAMTTVVSEADLRNLAVADIGTGTGILALAAACNGARNVLATDINARAVAIASQNFVSNGFGEVCHAVLGDLLPLGHEPIDVIVSNPPCMPLSDDAKSILPPAIRDSVDGGATGDQTTLRIIERAVNVLPCGGLLMIPVPRWADFRKLHHTLSSSFHCNVRRRLEVPYWIPFVFPAPDAGEPQGRPLAVVHISIVVGTRK